MFEYIEYKKSADRRSFCGTAQLGPVRVSTFVVTQTEGPGDQVTPVVILQPSIDLAKDKEKARREVLTNAIQIDEKCRRLGLALPFHPKD